MGRMLASVALILSLGVTPAGAALRDFSGRWRNVDTKTRGITTLEIRVDGTKAVVHAWGACMPQDCDLGEGTVTIYGDKVDVPIADGARALVVEFGTKTMMILTRVASGELRCDVFSRFTDQSGRANVMKADVLRLSPIQPGRK